jgi:NADPH:quinone reductase-like Zn-dependent oxidoreductase
MKAIVQDGYGSAHVLALRDIAAPVVGDNDVLVWVHAAGCGPDVWHLMTGLPYFARLMVGFGKPRVGVRGWDLAGRIEAVGSAVTGFQPGDGSRPPRRSGIWKEATRTARWSSPSEGSPALRTDRSGQIPGWCWCARRRS